MSSQQVLGNSGRGLLFIISAPAGTGKTTLVEMLLREFPLAIAKSCSCTTREPRPGEIDGQHYVFITEKEFKKKVDEGDFLEHAVMFGHHYGTPKSEVSSLLEQGKHVVLVIDTQGAIQLKEKVPALLIFIAPPSFATLRQRLVTRCTEDEEMIEERLSWAKEEMKMVVHYDYLITNVQLEITYQILRSIFIAEEHKRRSCVYDK